jgi:hypothetical protein
MFDWSFGETKVRDVEEFSKVRVCGREGEVIEYNDVAIRDFVVGDRGGGGLGARFTDF